MTALSAGDPVVRAVDAAIATATVDMDASPEERVAFHRDHLAAVVRLFKAEATRARTDAVISARLDEALDSAHASGLTGERWAQSPQWRDLMAARYLGLRLGSISTTIFITDGDGSLQEFDRRVLGEDLT